MITLIEKMMGIINLLYLKLISEKLNLEINKINEITNMKFDQDNNSKYKLL